MRRDQVARGPVQVPRAAVVAQSRPELEDILLVRGGQFGDRGEGGDEPLEVGDDGRDGRLLEHHLADPDAVRVTVAPPRQVAAMAGEPGQETPPKARCIVLTGRGGRHELLWRRNSEAQNPKSERTRAAPRLPSDFGFRISDLRFLGPWSAVVLLEDLGRGLGRVAGAQYGLRLGRLALLIRGRQFHDRATVRYGLVAQRSWVAWRLRAHAVVVQEKLSGDLVRRRTGRRCGGRGDVHRLVGRGGRGGLGRGTGDHLCPGAVGCLCPGSCGGRRIRRRDRGRLGGNHRDFQADPEFQRPDLEQVLIEQLDLALDQLVIYEGPVRTPEVADEHFAPADEDRTVPLGDGGAGGPELA